MQLDSKAVDGRRGMMLRLIGCDGDLGDLPQRLRGEGLDVRLPDAVEDGDFVAFCISCMDGPSAGTSQAIGRCAGHAIVPVAVVLTRYELLNDDSLCELVKCEELELLSRFLPRQEVERLPVYYDFDPGLARKLLRRMAEGIGTVTCSIV
jgi:hypothetical protein